MGGPVRDNEVLVLSPTVDSYGGDPSAMGGYLNRKYVIKNLKQIDKICELAYKKAVKKDATNKDMETYLKAQDKAAKFRDLLTELAEKDIEQMAKEHKQEIKAWVEAVSKTVNDETWNKIVVDYENRVGKNED